MAFLGTLLAVSLLINNEPPQVLAQGIGTSGGTTRVTVSGAVTLTSGEGHIGEVGGSISTTSAVFTRTTNTTAYTAGDLVSNDTTTTTMLTLTGAARISGGSGYITGVWVATDLKSITPRFRVHFYNVNTPTVSADNLPHRELYADLSKRIGYVDLPAMSTPVDTTNSTLSRASDATIRIPFVTSASTNIYAVVETLDAFTPASGQSITVRIATDRN